MWHLLNSIFTGFFLSAILLLDGCVIDNPDFGRDTGDSNNDSAQGNSDTDIDGDGDNNVDSEADTNIDLNTDSNDDVAGENGARCTKPSDCDSGACVLSWDDDASVCCVEACGTDERCGSEGTCQICLPGTQQSCWESSDGNRLPGDPAILKGDCRVGTRTCTLGGMWSECVGAIAPEETDDCSEAGADNDCNGTPNEGCTCVTGKERACGSDTGNCVAGAQTCRAGVWSQCEGEVKPEAQDSCAVEEDDANCNGIPNEDCACIGNEMQACGDCGEQTCNADARNFDSCSSPPGAPTTRCQSESTLLTCNPQGNWVESQCMFFCSVDACTGECVPGNTRCAGDPERRETCSEIGVWESTQECPSGTSCVEDGERCVKSDGQTCSAASECDSGFCVDNMCCTSACAGTCMACASALTGNLDGICAGIQSGTDPDNECTADPVFSCGRNGLCDGNGECALYDSSTVCADPTCSAGTATSARQCDGNNVCLSATLKSCASYICGTETCRTDCSANSHCSSGFVCVGSVCQSPSDLLGPCDEDFDCLRGECLANVCAVSIISIRIQGDAVSGGADPHQSLAGWFRSDSNGRNLVQVSSIPAGIWLYQSINLNQPLDAPLAPDNYLVLTSAESSNELTRTFTFNLSDGTAIVKEVTANSSASIVLSEYTGDLYKLFQWTGTDVVVLSKTY